MIINILLSISVALIVITSSLLLTLIMGLKSKVSSFLSIYVFSVANIIIVTQIASLFNQLNNRWFVFSFHLVILGVIFIFWKNQKQTNSLRIFLKNTFCFPEELVVLFKKNPLYSLLSALIVDATLFNAFIAIKVPANTNDGMIQHLSRVGYWLQHGSMAVWNTPLILQVIYPPNAQLQMLWTILFTGVDRFAPLIQWFAVPFSAIAIYGLSTKLGWSKEKSILTALLWMTLPQIVLQSTSTQNDLVSSGLVIISLYFLYSGLKRLQKKEILLSALTLALAIGTKQTIFLILPALAIIVVLFWWKSEKKLRGLLYLWSVASLGFFLLFGSYIYIQNMVKFKTPFGPSEVVSNTVVNKETSFIRNGQLKIARVIYQTFDLTEIPYINYGSDSKSMWVYKQAANLKAAVGSHIFSWFNFDLESSEGIEGYPLYKFTYLPILQIQEDITWFGPMMFLMIPAIIVSLVSAIRKKEKYTIGLVLIWVSLFISLNFFKGGWTPNQSRYYVLSVTATMPLVSALWMKDKKKIVNYCVLILAIIFMFFTILMNSCKPLLGSNFIWNKSDSELRGIQSTTIRDSIEKMDKTLPENTTIGVVLNGVSFDYPLFGRNFSHIIIPAFPIDQINDPDWLSDNKICYVLIADESTVEADPAIIHLIEGMPGWTIYQVNDSSNCQ